MENDRTGATAFVETIRNQRIHALIKVDGWHLVGIWSRLEVGQHFQNFDSSQNEIAYIGKSLRGSVVTVYTYLEGPNSILVKNKEIMFFILNSRYTAQPP